MRRTLELGVRWPRATIALGFLIPLAFVPGLLRLELRMDGQTLVPRDHPAVIEDREIRAEFDLEDPIAVVVETSHPEGIVNPETLRTVLELTRALQARDAIDARDVVSLATEKSGRVRPGSLEFQAFLEEVPRTPETLARLRDDVQLVEIYHGTLISGPDPAGAAPRATTILVGSDPDGDRAAVEAAVRDAVAEVPTTDTVHVVGAPVAESLLGTHVLADLATLIPAVLAIMAVIFAIAFRRGSGVLLPLLEVGLCLVFVFGLMGSLGVPIYLPTAVLPVILTAMGIADEIHVIHRYRHHRRRLDPAASTEAVRRTLQDMAAPISRTSITTALAFLSFTFSPLAPVASFGLFAAVGIVFCWLWSLTVIPALLIRFPWPAPAAIPIPSTSEGTESPSRLGPALIVIAWFGLLGAAAPGVTRVQVQDSWIDNFSPQSELRQSTDRVNTLFGGVHVLHICVDASNAVLSGNVSYPPGSGRGLPRELTLSPPPGETQRNRPAVLTAQPYEGPTHYLAARIPAGETDRLVLDPDPRYLPRRTRFWESVELKTTHAAFLHPEILTRVGQLETFLAELEEYEVGTVVGIRRHVAETQFLERGRRAEARRIGENPRRQREILEHYARVRGADRLREVIDPGYRRAIVTVYLANANFQATGNLLDEIADHAARELEPHGITLGLAGDVAVSQTLIAAVVETQSRSIALSLLGVLLVSTLLTRSPLAGILIVLPAASAVLINLAALGYLGVPLGVATSMFSAMVIGIGVDYAIHLLERCRQLARDGQLESATAVVREGVRQASRPILVDAIALGAGFGILVFSRVPTSARLGLLVLTSLVACWFVTIVVLPALLRLLPPRWLRRN